MIDQPNRLPVRSRLFQRNVVCLICSQLLLLHQGTAEVSSPSLVQSATRHENSADSSRHDSSSDSQSEHWAYHLVIILLGYSTVIVPVFALVYMVKHQMCCPSSGKLLIANEGRRRLTALTSFVCSAKLSFGEDICVRQTVPGDRRRNGVAVTERFGGREEQKFATDRIIVVQIERQSNHAPLLFCRFATFVLNVGSDSRENHD
jgi:hypothetical protein